MILSTLAGMLPVAIALMLGSTSSELISYGEKSSLQQEACTKVEKLVERKIIIYWKCDQNENDSRDKNDTWYRAPEPEVIQEPKKPKYKYKDSNICIPGLENISGCDSNSEEGQCPDGSVPFMRQIISLDGDDAGQVIRTFRLCPGESFDPELPEDEFVVEIRVSPEQFRAFPILASDLQSDPEKFSLRNGHSHFWAETESQTFNSTVLGAQVRVKAIPDGWNWKYGDGTTRNLDFPGEPAPNHTLRDETPTSHSYKETGTYSVGLTTLFRGEFSVDGGPWQSIPGQAAVPSDPIEIDVWRTKKELIARD